jgi:hypothetical protein
VEHHLEHLRAWGLDAPTSAPELFVTEEEIRQGERLLRAVGAEAPGPGQCSSSREPRQAALARAEVRAARPHASAEGFDVAILAGPGEEPYVRVGVFRKAGIPGRSGLSLRQPVCALSAAAGYAGNDGGPAHASAASGEAHGGHLRAERARYGFLTERPRARCVFEERRAGRAIFISVSTCGAWRGGCRTSRCRNRKGCGGGVTGRPPYLCCAPARWETCTLITPALRALRNAFPKSRLTALVTRPGREILAGNPDVDESRCWTRAPGGLRWTSSAR